MKSRGSALTVTPPNPITPQVCDSETVGKGDPFLKRLMDYFEANGDVASAQELVPC